MSKSYDVHRATHVLVLSKDGEVTGVIDVSHLIDTGALSSFDQLNPWKDLFGDLGFDTEVIGVTALPTVT